MPYSKVQRRAAGMAEHASPAEIAKAGPAVQQMAKSMAHSQLHDFASGSEKGLPERLHKHKKQMAHHGRGSDNMEGRRRNPRGNPY